MQQLDILGLVILAAAISLILIPLNLVEDSQGWKKRKLVHSKSFSALTGAKLASVVTMLVVGCVLLVLFFVYDLMFAPRPVVSPRFCQELDLDGRCMDWIP